MKKNFYKKMSLIVRDISVEQGFCLSSDWGDSGYAGNDPDAIEYDDEL